MFTGSAFFAMLGQGVSTIFLTPLLDPGGVMTIKSTGAFLGAGSIGKGGRIGNHKRHLQASSYPLVCIKLLSTRDHIMHDAPLHFLDPRWMCALVHTPHCRPKHVES
ncbi:hypothetical protein PAXRUDRAFT_483953 [Paxillus rubicundulus Ve08.2h10]|uniref:Uncharacterized protein n=1 Tax=Paxillus rubicundulus Ve08.2h10 TaxID=930991 RepID=A0A0D0DW38_9AGAM|nr:hypothetical protein PAXRUDRAFT_483953 [Paxillus rubicundulus Ve08.2h10]